MTILDAKISRLDGTSTTLGEITGGKPALLVNVASKCGLTPQYTGLEELQERYAEKGFTVVGLPCNQFFGQEPGSAEEIQEFCSATYGVTFPMTEKIDVNGDDRHEIYATLTETPNEKGEAGDVTWNFEKFLIDGTGSVVARFSPQVVPEDPTLVAAVQAQLA
ncbi:glutathione peroxidase [Nocardioides sp. CN2-186]|uniref:glutathione peroxidase n=1 Tax=Nocardioides tweenelious TaxID=3156607 RepID=UPI0032B3CB11